MTSKQAAIAARKKINAIIQAYMDKRDYPDWFRGFSTFQKEAADSLLNDIRDDSQQGTTHRIRNTLIRLGINPLVNNRKIKIVMDLSRGNDIAFLWFMMEMYYRHTCDDCRHKTELGYSLNEQILMTAIAHLDTIPTLRELDKWLPQQPEKPKKEKPPKQVKPKKDYPLPYFAKQPRPVQYGKSLLMQHLDTIPNLSIYDKYRNPSYAVPNENSKWFATYALKEKDRNAKDEVKNTSKLEDAGFFAEFDDNPLFCAHHSALELLKDSMTNELKVLKKKESEKYFDMNGRLKHHSHKRVIDMLDKEMANNEQYFNKFNTPEMKNEIVQRCPIKGIASRQNEVTDNDYRHAQSALGKKHYFEGPTAYKPNKCNYDNIFDAETRNPVRDAISNALKECSSGNMPSDEKKTLQECCKDIWYEELREYNKFLEEKEKKLKNRTPHPKMHDLGFDLPYYDPTDKKLMEAMVHKALQEIGKNKKFVLASMPNAHKVPIIKEFAKKRYGLMYKRDEKIKEFRLSKKIFGLLQRHEAHVRLPVLSDLSEKRVVSYACKDYILKKTNYLRERYHHNFKMNFMDDVRIYWGAMRPFQCSRGPPRNVFFSYFPARENDVHMFRPWKTCEYMPAKQEWDKKQLIKRMALRY